VIQIVIALIRGEMHVSGDIAIAHGKDMADPAMKMDRTACGFRRFRH
jgi:hypothetical protein